MVETIELGSIPDALPQPVLGDRTLHVEHVKDAPHAQVQAQRVELGLKALARLRTDAVDQEPGVPREGGVKPRWGSLAQIVRHLSENIAREVWTRTIVCGTNHAGNERVGVGEDDDLTYPLGARPQASGGGLLDRRHAGRDCDRGLGHGSVQQEVHRPRARGVPDERPHRAHLPRRGAVRAASPRRDPAGGHVCQFPHGQVRPL